MAQNYKQNRHLTCKQWAQSPLFYKAMTSSPSKSLSGGKPGTRCEMFTSRDIQMAAMCWLCGCNWKDECSSARQREFSPGEISQKLGDSGALHVAFWEGPSKRSIIPALPFAQRFDATAMCDDPNKSEERGRTFKYFSASFTKLRPTTENKPQMNMTSFKMISVYRQYPVQFLKSHNHNVNLPDFLILKRHLQSNISCCKCFTMTKKIKQCKSLQGKATAIFRLCMLFFSC